MPTSRCFFQQISQAGPKVALTDNCREERLALKTVWPTITLFVCTFHFLQALWRWLHEKKNNISMSDRPILMDKVKQMIYAKSSEELDELYAEITSSNIFERNPTFHSYFEIAIWNNKVDWCLLFRKGLPTRGNNTSNYVEAQFRVMKDEILNRIRCYNIVEVLDRLTVHLENHHKDKLLSVANGSFDGIFSPKFYLKYQKKAKEFDPNSIKTINRNLLLFKVKSSTSEETHDVDLTAGFCTCPDGNDGKLCKHQAAVMINFRIDSLNVLPMYSPKERQMYSYIASGNSLPLKYYLDLQGKVSDLNDPEATFSVRENKEVKLKVDVANDTPLDQTAEYQISTINDSMPPKEEAKDALEGIQRILSSVMEKEDPHILTGLIKMYSRLQTMNTTQVASALHCFGGRIINDKALRKTASVLLGKAKKGRISVGPEAVKRRKQNPSRSRKALPKGRLQDLSLKLPNKTNYTKRRKHSIELNIKNNTQVAKKAGRSMGTKSKPELKRVVTINHERKKGKTCEA